MIFNLRAKEVLGVIESDSTKLVGSYDSVLKINKIGGVCEQGENPSPTNKQEVKNSVVSGLKTHRKNFLKNTILTKVTTMYGVTFTPNSEGNITVNGTASQWFPQAINQELRLTHGREYIFSGCPTGGGYYTYYMYIEIKLSDGKSVVYRDEGNGVTFTYPTNATKAYIAIGINENITLSNLVFKPMIREVGTDDTYEIYTEAEITFTEPVELYGIGDVQDELTPKGISRKFKKAVFNGSEDWTIMVTGTTGLYRLSPNNVIAKGIGAYNVANIICDKYKAMKANDTYQCIDGISVENNGRIGIYDGNYNSVSAWITYLSENPITVVYELAEPIIEEVSLEDQLALNELQTFAGITHVEFDSEVQPTLNCDYATNLVGAVALSVYAYNEIEKRYVSYADDGSANFTGNINGAAYIYGKNVQAQQMVFAEAVQTWKDIVCKGSVNCDNFVIANNLQAQQMVFAQGVQTEYDVAAKVNVTAQNNVVAQNELRGKDLHFTNMGVNGGAAQPVEWVWDEVLARWVLCSVQTQ